jgi:hypothetical protein
MKNPSTIKKSSKKERVVNFFKKCPRCGEKSLVVSIFGSICGNDKCNYPLKISLPAKRK